VLGLLARGASAQAAPQLATLVQPLPLAWEACRLRASEVLKAQGYTGFLGFGNGWIAHARGTAASIACIPQSGRSVLVIVTAGGQLVRESTRLFEEIRGPETQPPPQDSTPPATASDSAGSGWSATAVALAGAMGSRYNFWCPPHGVPGEVWGDLVYAAESSVCAAAVHAGTLSVEAGGNAIIEIRAAQQSYSASSRNGIATRARGPSKASFVFVSRSP
jgi:LCCL domain-containing protein